MTAFIAKKVMRAFNDRGTGYWNGNASLHDARHALRGLATSPTVAIFGSKLVVGRLFEVLLGD